MILLGVGRAPEPRSSCDLDASAVATSPPRLTRLPRPIPSQFTCAHRRQPSVRSHSSRASGRAPQPCRDFATPSPGACRSAACNLACRRPRRTIDRPAVRPPTRAQRKRHGQQAQQPDRSCHAKTPPSIPCSSPPRPPLSSSPPAVAAKRTRGSVRDRPRRRAAAQPDDRDQARQRRDLLLEPHRTANTVNAPRGAPDTTPRRRPVYNLDLATVPVANLRCR